MGKKQPRISTKREYAPRKSTGSVFADQSIDLTEFLEPYEEFRKMYADIEGGGCKHDYTVDSKIFAYKITFDDIPDFFVIIFEKSGDRARGKALMYLREFHPRFINGGWIQEFRVCHRKKFPLFDKYVSKGRVPIPELMKEGMSFPCSVCGSDKFTYEDYDIGRCFYVSGENNPTPFVDGFVLCYSCAQKYL